MKALSVPVSKADELKKFYRIIASDERNTAVLKPVGKVIARVIANPRVCGRLAQGRVGVALDKSEVSVKRKDLLGGAGAALPSRREVED